MWVCRAHGGRPIGRKADPGGNLRARASFNHREILLLKWETKDYMLFVWDRSSFY